MSDRPDVAAYGAAVDALLALDPVALSSAELLDVVAEVERQNRRMVCVGHLLVAELEARGVAGELGQSSTAAVLRQLLRISPGEAAARVRAAGELGPRCTLNGEVLEPVFASVAAAQAAGTLSAAHARAS